MNPYRTKGHWKRIWNTRRPWWFMRWGQKYFIRKWWSFRYLLRQTHHTSIQYHHLGETLYITYVGTTRDFLDVTPKTSLGALSMT